MYYVSKKGYTYTAVLLLVVMAFFVEEATGLFLHILSPSGNWSKTYTVLKCESGAENGSLAFTINIARTFLFPRFFRNRPRIATKGFCMHELLKLCGYWTRFLNTVNVYVVPAE